MQQVFINIVGHNASGKTTLAKELAKDLPLNRVSGDDFREFVYNSVAYFEDTDMSFPNDKYSELNPLALTYRFELTDILLKAGQNVLFDGSGSTRDIRARYLDKVQANYSEVIRVIIWADLSEQTLITRLQKRGKSWARQFAELKRYSFQPPETDEAEVVIRYDQKNYSAILRSIKDLGI